MKILAPVGILLAGALVLAEVSMQPNPSERVTLLLLFGGAAVLTVALARVVPGWLARAGSVRHSVAAPPLLAIGIAAVTVLVSAGLMFLSSHDLRMFIAALALGVGLAITLARALSEELETDMESLAATAVRVAEGDKTARTGIDRPDELGSVARAFDSMIEQLSDAEEARTNLLASLGHDLRTPLSAMQAAVESLQDGITEDPGRYLASIATDIQTVSGLIDDLFFLARLEGRAGGLERLPVDLAELADEAAEALEPIAARAGVTIEVTTQGNTKVHGAPRELGRAIRNLLDNALRHTPPRSRVRVQLSNGGAHATLRVIDEGPGFPPDIRTAALGRFPTGRPTNGHTGLGLAIVNTIVEAHAGSMWIEDGPGGSIAFNLPVTETQTIPI